MATNPISNIPELAIYVENAGDECTFHCSGRIVSATVDSLKSEVKPAIGHFKSVVLDLTDGRITAENLRRAHAQIESNKSIGKLVLEGF